MKRLQSHIKSFCLITILFLLSTVATGVYGQKAQPTFTSITLQPTVAYVKYHSENRRVVRLLFRDGKSYSAGSLAISFNDYADNIAIPASVAGLDVFEVPLPGPAIKVSTQVTVTLKSSGQNYVARCIVEPARTDWNVYILPHSHVDIGYTNTQAKVLKLHMDNIDESIDLAEKHRTTLPKPALNGQPRLYGWWIII